MSKIEDDKYIRRTRATWLAGKLDMNFARAHAIVHKLMPANRSDQKKISEVIKAEMRAPLYKKQRNK